MIILYLVAINVAAFFVYGIDKRKAKKSKWRISEKTAHAKFKYGVPLILLAQVVLVVWITIKL